MVDESYISEGEINHLTEDEKDTINIIIKDYGHKEPYVLREMTHSEVSWKIARGDLLERVNCNTVITKESMGAYYEDLYEKLGYDTEADCK